MDNMAGVNRAGLGMCRCFRDNETRYSWSKIGLAKVCVYNSGTLNRDTDIGERERGAGLKTMYQGIWNEEENKEFVEDIQ